MEISKLYPQFKDYIWGGEKLKEKYGKKTELSPCAESWELSFHKDGLTMLEDGASLYQRASEEDLGENLKDFPFFPTLIKFIDAKSDLSVQVHPSDEYALKNENSFGKTEMWYIVEADTGAGIYLGFKRPVTVEEYKNAITENRLTELLNFYPVRAGECYFIPSGTIHAIGGGCLICEIQQNSNLTYRVYDYGRKDKNGNPRELHVEKALAVTQLGTYSPSSIGGNILGISKYFTAKKLTLQGSMTLSADKSTFNCITCTEGSGYIDKKKISLGDSFFVPAAFGDYELSGNGTFILTEIRKYYLNINRNENLLVGKLTDDRGATIYRLEASDCDPDTLTQIMLSKLNMTRDDIEIITVS